jgi:hypothetical protein
MSEKLDRATATLMALKLVEPGQLRDIAAGLQRLFRSVQSYERAKLIVEDQVPWLRETGLVCLYHGSRYLLTDEGKAFVARTGLWEKLENRRMFLLKESRKSSFKWRSNTRDGSL